MQNKKIVPPCYILSLKKLFNVLYQKYHIYTQQNKKTKVQDGGASFLVIDVLCGSAFVFLIFILYNIYAFSMEFL